MKHIAIAAILGLTASVANAEEIVLTAPMAGATVHESGTDMSVFWTETDAGYEVVATYVSAEAPNDPSRLVMVLADGDALAFGLPGQSQALYQFSRNGDDVTVSAQRAPNQFASK
ncbi:hypothetical protein KHP62_04345 [Rhodobacteraceae bacterium NNCM2]|nr:hypothetical protein [Coraliihabitans acroporae]